MNNNDTTRVLCDHFACLGQWCLTPGEIGETVAEGAARIKREERNRAAREKRAWVKEQTRLMKEKEQEEKIEAAWEELAEVLQQRLVEVEILSIGDTDEMQCRLCAVFITDDRACVSSYCEMCAPFYDERPYKWVRDFNDPARYIFWQTPLDTFITRSDYQLVYHYEDKTEEVWQEACIWYSPSTKLFYGFFRDMDLYPNRWEKLEDFTVLTYEQAVKCAQGFDGVEDIPIDIYNAYYYQHWYSKEYNKKHSKIVRNLIETPKKVYLD